MLVFLIVGAILIGLGVRARITSVCSGLDLDIGSPSGY